MNEVATTVVEHAHTVGGHIDVGLSYLEGFFNLSWLVDVGEWMTKMGGSTEVVDDWAFKAGEYR